MTATHTERERRQPGCLKQLSRGRLAAARCAVCVRSVAVEIHWWGEIRSDPWHNRRSEEHHRRHTQTQTLAHRSSRVFIARTGMTGAKLRDFCPRDAFSGPPWRTAAPGGQSGRVLDKEGAPHSKSDVACCLLLVACFPPLAASRLAVPSRRTRARHGKSVFGERMCPEMIRIWHIQLVISSRSKQQSIVMLMRWESPTSLVSCSAQRTPGSQVLAFRPNSLARRGGWIRRTDGQWCDAMPCDAMLPACNACRADWDADAPRLRGGEAEVRLANKEALRLERASVGVCGVGSRPAARFIQISGAWWAFGG